MALREMRDRSSESATADNHIPHIDHHTRLVGYEIVAVDLSVWVWRFERPEKNDVHLSTHIIDV